MVGRSSSFDGGGDQVGRSGGRVKANDERARSLARRIDE